MFLSILLSIVINTSLDSTVVCLGDQTGLRLEANCNADEYVRFPQFGKQLIEGVEIVRQGAIDSTVDQQGKHYKQELMLTSFEDSLFFIEPIAFVSGNDTVYSETITLNFVQPFVLDSTTSITDIRGIQKAPIWWWGYIRWILGALLLAGIGALIWWLLGKIGGYNGSYVAEKKKEPERPAEDVALEQLDRIREEKIWTQGRTKQYHTELTDVLRTYIAKRFGVASTEKTSDETLQAMKPILVESQKSQVESDAAYGRDLYNSLAKVLQLADLVKFAKWQATPDENEQALHIAYDFVNETKPAPVQPQAEEEELKS
ncbi:MAG: hypothetical protein IJS92_06735 [Paludibacteraceae bacterium]|nr:hypothetical protein [Paludibacteraceae bacterium]